MRVAVSPYHLTTREPPAMAALLLAERVVTLIPSPRGEFGKADVQRAAERSPRYVRLMKSWEWSMPLWREGVLQSSFEGRDASADVLDVCAKIGGDPALVELRPLMRPELFDDDERYLDAISHDVLRAGPDPCFSVPLAAGLDRFAARFSMFVARAEPVSVVQKAEARLGRSVFAVAIPVLIEADGAQIVRAREALAEPLRALRRALVIAGSGPLAGATGVQGSGRSRTDELAAGVRAAAAEYAEAFERVERTLSTPDDEQRAVSGFVAIEGVELPGDAALRSSLAAVRRMNGSAAPIKPARVGTELAIAGDPLALRPVVSLLIRKLGTPARPARR